jgi:ribonuclease P protein component
MRRVLRELFRTQQHEICHVDLVVRVQKKFDQVNYIQIKQEFNLLVNKLNQRVSTNTPSTKPLDAQGND